MSGVDDVAGDPPAAESASASASSSASAGASSSASTCASSSSSAPRQLGLWKRQRNITKVNTQREIDKCRNLLQNDTATEQEIRVSQKKLQNYGAQLRTYNEQILPHVPDAEIEAELTDADQREETVNELVYTIDAIFAAREHKAQSIPGSSPSTSTQPASAEKASTKLPKLHIEPFAGFTLKWREFWDTFNVTVHTRADLSSIEKFQYLKSFLRDEALRIISGYTLSEATYDTTVAALKLRYDKPEMCINSHLDVMIYMKECQNDVSAIQKTFDDCESHIRELIALGMAEETFERVFAPLVISKFPRFVRVELNRKNAGAPWTLENLRQYLRDEITARQLGLQTIGTSGLSDKSPGKSSGKDRDNRDPNRKLKNGTASGMIGSGKEKKAVPQDKKTQKYPCAFCHSENHLPDNCDKYKTVNDRIRVLKPDQCLLCLGVNHKIAQCRSRRACKYCGATGTHHQSLCFKEHGGDRKPDSANASGLNADAASVCSCGIAPSTCISRFARLALLKDVKAKKIADEHLGLAGLAASERQYAKFGCYEIKLVCLDGEEITVAVTGLNSVTCPVERQPLRVQDYPIIKQFKLADPVEKPDGPLQLDVLIGLDQYYRFVGHIAVRLSDTLVLLETKLGYVVNGSTTTDRSDQKETALLSIECSADDNQLDKNLERLWELEDVGTADPAAQLTPEEVIAIESFEKEISYDQKEKRYSVRWPWKENRRELPDNYGLALGRLKGLIQRIDKPTLVVYNDTIAEQLKKGVVEVALKTPSGEEIHYIPHHCVVRPDRATTKVRIVYDASAKASKSSPSLNDCMFPGPVILADLCGLLIRFRQGPIGIISDIEKAFLQVRLKPVDRDVTRFLWVKDINRPPTPGNLIVYRFTSVCFGVTASPYMLAGTIKHHLTKIGTPVAKQILTNCYVDNVITCVNSTSEAVAYYNEAKQLFNLASMNLREWFSNDQKFMICVDDNDQGNSRRTTVLGMDWDLDSDSLRCRSKTDAETCGGTKRALLQAIAQLFDPCGLLSPVSITGKIMMQDLWKLKIGWDDQFSEEQRIRAQTIIQNLKIAVELSVPRHIGYGQGITVQLHCFVDASRAAYAAVTYQRTTLPDGFTKSRLLFSKAKVAPAKKPLTIPKLELSAVDLRAKLLRFLTTELRCPIGALFVWSDSMCAIQWVRGNFRKPVFVRNRVDRVRSVENLVVRYVPTAKNPADIPSKVMTVDELEKTTVVARTAVADLGVKGMANYSGDQRVFGNDG